MNFGKLVKKKQEPITKWYWFFHWKCDGVSGEPIIISIIFFFQSESKNRNKIQSVIDTPDILEIATAFPETQS